jgi:hypothetical protein
VPDRAHRREPRPEDNFVKGWLDDAVEAVRYVESGQKTDNVVLRMNGVI